MIDKIQLMHFCTVSQYQIWQNVPPGNKNEFKIALKEHSSSASGEAAAANLVFGFFFAEIHVIHVRK